MTLVIVIVGVLAVAGIGAIAYILLSSESAGSADVQGFLATQRELHHAEGGEEGDFDVEEIKRLSGKSKAQDNKEDLTAKLFRAGYYGPEALQRFKTAQIVSPVIVGAIAIFVMNAISDQITMIIIGGVLGVFAGAILPTSRLDKKIRQRDEEMMYYLPLVVEQVAIGVSSSLDIGPCIAYIVEMATERGSHNAVTELFVHVERLIRSGLNLEDALIEVGEVSGHNEVKHAFMFLAQCAKHGGEITKQLQELADAVSNQRQVQVEARIASLPVKATGPLVVVFGGFFALLFAGLFVRMMTAFG